MSRRHRIVLCWTDISGYMTACWRALAAEADVELRVLAFKPAANWFSQDLIADINCRLLDEKEREDGALVASLVREHRPDVVYVSGWFHPAYRKLLSDRSLASVRKWMGVDTPWRGTLKQQVGRLLLRGVVGRADRIWVAGERAWQYMRVLGVPQQKVSRGLYGIDYDALAPLYEQRVRRPEGWPRWFLFIGRYHRQKGIATLMDAYEEYRRSVKGPWPLGCCGSGPLEGLLAGREGVENFGFRQPQQLGEILAGHGAFVLASEYDPWPLVVVESCAAGLPVVCTEACGSSVELVRSYYNGITVASRDADVLARALRWVHDHPEQLPEMGRRGRELAAAYSAQMWAARWAQALREPA